MNKKKFIEVELFVFSIEEDEVLTASKNDFDGTYDLTEWHDTW